VDASDTDEIEFDAVCARCGDDPGYMIALKIHRSGVSEPRQPLCPACYTEVVSELEASPP
jgi:hypothetical protein